MDKFTYEELGLNKVDTKILKAFKKGSLSNDDFPEMTKEQFSNSLWNIQQMLWGLFPNLKNKKAFVYDNKTKKYTTLFKVE
tara:strand:+ start:844 stop:1086 length:243 start_codon:yes stop_codon:yes gene_type:complete